jgi:hypothetical protein
LLSDFFDAEPLLKGLVETPSLGEIRSAAACARARASAGDCGDAQTLRSMLREGKKFLQISTKNRSYEN